MDKLITTTIVSKDNTFHVKSLLNIDSYNAVYPGNYLTKVWPPDKSLFNILIYAEMNKPLVNVFGLPEAFDLDIDDIKDVIFDINDFLILSKFYSEIRISDIPLSQPEKVFFSGLASKILCIMLEEINTRLPSIKYIALEASGEDMDFLVDVKYPSLGFKHMMKTDEHLNSLKLSQDVPMFAKVSIVLKYCKRNVCSSCGSINAVYYCDHCYKVKFCNEECRNKYERGSF